MGIMSGWSQMAWENGWTTTNINDYHGPKGILTIDITFIDGNWPHYPFILNLIKCGIHPQLKVKKELLYKNKSLNNHKKVYSKNIQKKVL